MRGMMMKDLIFLKNKYRLLYGLLALAIYLTAVYFYQEPALIIGMILTIFFSISLAMPLFMQDDKEDWLYFSSTLPISVKEWVLARYVTLGLLLAAITVFNLVLALVFSLLVSGAQLGLYLVVIGLAVMVTVVYLVILVPAIFALGINGISMVFLVLMLLGTALQKFAPISKIVQLQQLSPMILVLMAVAVCVVPLIASIQASINLAGKKQVKTTK